IRRGGVDRRRAGMRGPWPAAPRTPGQAFAREEIGDRARRRPVAPPRMPTLQHLEQFPRAPVVVLDAKLAEQRGHLVGDLVRAMVRGSAPVRQAAASLLGLAIDPLVAGLPADLV